MTLDSVASFVSVHTYYIYLLIIPRGDWMRGYYCNISHHITPFRRLPHPTMIISCAYWILHLLHPTMIHWSNHDDILCILGISIARSNPDPTMMISCWYWMLHLLHPTMVQPWWYLVRIECYNCHIRPWSNHDDILCVLNVTIAISNRTLIQPW